MSEDIYDIGKELGMNEDDIKSILKEVSEVEKDKNFIKGPPCYAGLDYGTISILDF